MTTAQAGQGRAQGEGQGGARTLGELLQIPEYAGRAPFDGRVRLVQDEVRDNLTRKLRSGEELFPGVVGYDDTVIPQLVNALLARQNFILLGLRGQAKSRILRAITELLDPVVPVIDGVDMPDDPLNPVGAEGRHLLEERGLDLPIRWLPRAERYVENLATSRSCASATCTRVFRPLRARWNWSTRANSRARTTWRRT